MADNLTYEETLILARLAHSPLDDRDGVPERVLINSGYAERIDPGKMKITAAGRSWLTAHGYRD
ncbi:MULTISPECIES: hypothetical protein [unclassified Bradyrhizobium]|uniref:hypothetical protein n=1 Tax=unclassified Bradyrhizobium TaxID=2631580 RepID=UPI0028EBD606|nr:MULTISPECIES: hypothetical protein [unclassified Bradyrhizobium]